METNQCSDIYENTFHLIRDAYSAAPMNITLDFERRSLKSSFGEFESISRPEAEMKLKHTSKEIATILLDKVFSLESSFKISSMVK